MNTSETERRRYLRGGLVARIEDATYRVLRRNQDEESKGEVSRSEFDDVGPIPVVNVTPGLSECGQPGEPF
jgi:hypothetical protein